MSIPDSLSVGTTGTCTGTGVLVGVDAFTGVFVGVLVGVMVGVFVGVVVGVLAGVFVGVLVATPAGVLVGVFVGVLVGVFVGVLVGGVSVPVGVFVGVLVGATGWNAAVVATPPSLIDVEPAVKFVALVLITRTFELVPGAIAVEKENPTSLPATLRSAPDGATVPLTKTPPDRLPPSVRKPTEVMNPRKLLSISRTSESQVGLAPPQLVEVVLFVI
jgi:hypothetical protein